RSASWREPDQTDVSLRTIRSSSMPPNSIAPNRPLPMGDDSTKLVAGASNQIVVSDGTGTEFTAPNRAAQANAKIHENHLIMVVTRLPKVVTGIISDCDTPAASSRNAGGNAWQSTGWH